MEVSPQPKTRIGLSASRLLRWGEYGTFLAIFPGLVGAVLTSQWIWAMSPLTLSLWFNVFRRLSGDRALGVDLRYRTQNALHRYESVLVSLQHDRSEFLLQNTAQLSERDLPQFTQVIQFRLRCMDEKQQALTDYLQDSYQALQTEFEALHQLQNSQMQQLQNYQHHDESRAGFTLGSVNSTLAEIQNRFDVLEQQWKGFEFPFLGIPQRLSQMEAALDHWEHHRQQSKTKPQAASLDQLWAELEPPLRDRITHLQGLVDSESSMPHQLGAPSQNLAQLEQQINVMFQTFMSQLSYWEEMQWEQGSQLQRLGDKLATCQISLAHIHDDIAQQNTLVAEAIGDAYRSAIQDIVPELDFTPETFRRNIETLQQQLRVLASSNPEEILDSELTQVCETLTARRTVLEQSFQRENEEDEVLKIVTPLLHHLSECDEKFTQIPSWNALSQRLDALNIQLRQHLAHTETLKNRYLEELAVYNELYVKLSMMRFKTEELRSQVEIELDQIPYLIDNHLRRRFPTLLKE